MVNSINATEFSNLVASGKKIDLIDVRTPVEFREVHVTIARNEPLDRLDPQAIQGARNGTSAEPLYIICRSGARGKQACEKFFASGIHNVINVEGGTQACITAGLPVVRGKQALPLNCQVQIITGSVVLSGVILSFVTSNFYWLALPTFMGAGLMFSGLTNTCAMGTMLSRMSWNQIKPTSASAGSSNSNSCSTSNGCCN
jgi:rhodanese-related sulfurtransferase